MQGLMFKFGERRDDWRCCFCCHVRTATIFLGVWHLMLHVLTLSVIAVILRHPEMMNEQNSPGTSIPLPMPTPQSSSGVIDIIDENSLGSNSAFKTSQGITHKMYGSQHLNVSVVVMFSTFAITLLMVYGAIKGKPSYLMPFFCLQLFDFCIASLTALSYLCYLPDMHRLVAESPKIPMQSALLKLSPQCLALVVLLTFGTAMFVKTYFIGVVWSCYKYLSLRLVSTQRTIHFIDQDAQDLLPDYETACSKFPPPPPSYNQAVLEHQEQQNRDPEAIPTTQIINHRP
ncbi:lysosomal-associated transmembrane protein 4A isoform X2 [Cimex lectularius]|nr:lysosomal-associated transmembrane protein 4A isoform X2 [Cimex lectularius]XP_014254907.1 lysosomal-associated transmembrane protein 4A isoform X2 [Cimex lectularius]XP_014254908.1 lysosomal-associated transmembrane protein 4A isoform X2 [Cimex lectularius]